MILTPTQEQLLRKRPQSTKLWLSIYRPKTLLACQVNGTFSSGEINITYDNVSSGAFANVPANVTCLIGSTLGASDVGRLRVRSITSTTITFAENEVVWRDNLFLTIVDFVDVVPIYPRIIQDPSNATNVIFYKDYDLAYTNQNTIYGTFPCAGPHRAGFITTGSFGTFYSSTGSYNVKGDSLTFDWAFEGGTPTGSTSRDPGLVQYTTPGHYRTRLIITSSSGALDTTYRYVSVYQHPANGTNTPILKWELTNFSGSRGEGGYTVGIKMMEDIGAVEPNALVVIFAEDNYGGTLTSLGGNAINNSSIVFAGYILSDSIKFDYMDSTVEFNIGSVSEVLKVMEGFSVSCESVPSASRWYELSEMTVQKAIYHYLRWHTTILNVADFQYTGDDRFVQYFDADRESLWDSVDNFVRNGLLGETVVDRQGKIWSEIASYGLVAPFTSLPSNGITLDKQDWIGEPTITERRVSDTSFIELGGIAYYGVTSNTFSALLSTAPGNAPLYRGKSERQEGLILISQQQLNQVNGNYLAHRNSPFPEIALSLGGNYRNFDIAPQEQTLILVEPSDTIRNISLRNLRYRVSSMTWEYNSTKQTFRPDITLEQMVTGTIGQTLLIPLTPPQDGFDYPDLFLPPLPVFNSSDTPGPAAPTSVILHDTVKGLIYCEDFDAASPNYYTINAGLTQNQYQMIDFIFVTPNGALYVGNRRVVDSSNYSTADADGLCFIARAAAPGLPFTILYNEPSIRPSPIANTWGLFAAGFNPDVSEQVGIVMGQTSGNKALFIGANTSFTAGAAVDVSSSSSNFPGGLSYGGPTGNKRWLYLTILHYERISANGMSTEASAATTFVPLSTTFPTRGHVRAEGSGIIFSAIDSVQGIGMSADNMATTTSTTDSNARKEGLGVDGTGLLMMSRYQPGNKGKSFDGGAAWSFLPNLPPSSAYVWAYAGNGGSSPTSSRWIAAQSVIRFSPNGGNDWYNKEGNINLIVAVPDINMVYVPFITTNNY